LKNSTSSDKKAIGIAIGKIKRSCHDICHLLRSLSHPQRMMVLCYLSQGDKTVSELQDLCNISQSQLSQFLVRMKSEGLIESRREGHYQIYSIADSRISKIIRSLENICCDSD
jgi:DNA-binding transcriptional ArsR family regulator